MNDFQKAILKLYAVAMVVYAVVFLLVDLAVLILFGYEPFTAWEIVELLAVIGVFWTPIFFAPVLIARRYNVPIEVRGEST